MKFINFAKFYIGGENKLGALLGVGHGRGGAPTTAGTPFKLSETVVKKQFESAVNGKAKFRGRYRNELHNGCSYLDGDPLFIATVTGKVFVPVSI